MVLSESSKQLKVPSEGSGRFRGSSKGCKWFQVKDLGVRVPSEGSRKAFEVKERFQEVPQFQVQ